MSIMKSTAETVDIKTENELIFWQRYKIVLSESGLSEKQCEWHTTWVKRFINYNRGRRLAECSQAELIEFFNNLAHSNPPAEDWQQAADALRILYQRILHAPWSYSWDWSCVNTANTVQDDFELPCLIPDIKEMAQNNIHKISEDAQHIPVVETYPVPDIKEPAQNKVCIIPEVAQHIPAVEKLRAVMLDGNYSPHTIQAYESWIHRFIAYHNPRAPEKLDYAAVQEYLEFLAADRKVAASTQNQALHALKFLYENVLEKTHGSTDIFSGPRMPRRTPEVLNHEEIRHLFNTLTGIYAVMGGLLYGSGLLTSECAGLRVADIDFDHHRITVRSSDSTKERTTVLANKFRPMLRKQLEKAGKIYENDTERGFIETCEWEKQYVFPSPRLSVDQKTGKIHRHHINVNSLQKAIRDAALKAGLTKPVNCRTLRHSFIAHLLESGYNVRTVQELAGHRNISTTLVYMNVLNRPGTSVISPADI